MQKVKRSPKCESITEDRCPDTQQQVTLKLSPMSFEFFDPETNTMRVRRGHYEILYGTSSADRDLKKLSLEL